MSTDVSHPPMGRSFEETLDLKAEVGCYVQILADFAVLKTPGSLYWLEVTAAPASPVHFPLLRTHVFELPLGSSHLCEAP